MRRLSLFLLALLTVLSVMGGLGAIAPVFAAQPGCPTCCSDGQSMEGRGACTCRPPLKYLPGNICGSGKKAGTQPNQPGVAPFRGIQCKPGQNTASGCNCTGELVLFPGGVCNYRTSARAACVEGQDMNAMPCVCRSPFKIDRGHCVRLAANESRPLQKPACRFGAILTNDCACTPPRKPMWYLGRQTCSN